MKPQLARIITIVQWILTILLVLNFVVEFRSPEWNARNEGVSTLLVSMVLLIMALRERWEKGRWPVFVLVMVGLALATTVVVHWF